MMDRVQRAHIFSAFDALKGFRELLQGKERIVVPKRYYLKMIWKC